MENTLGSLKSEIRGSFCLESGGFRRFQEGVEKEVGKKMDRGVSRGDGEGMRSREVEKVVLRGGFWVG